MPPPEMDVGEAKELICDMCRNFYTQGWCSGSGGGISIKVGANKIVMAPSGVQKERMLPSDMYVLDGAGEVLEEPTARPPPYKPPKLSECAPLFMSAYEMRDAGAVLHSHSPAALMATILDPTATEFRITQVEMIKGIEDTGFYDECVVPIIENTARECELTDRLQAAIRAYPKANAVLVRRHGVYVWGKTWMQAKTQAECYDYLFDIAARMKAAGIDYTTGPCRPSAAEANGDHSSSKKRKLEGTAAPLAPSFVVLDIEGTTSPMTYVADVLFPYAKKALRSHLEATWTTTETQDDVSALRALAASEGGTGIPESGSPADLVEATFAYVTALMAADKKVGPLKQLQGHIWRGGFESGELAGDFYPDVAPALASLASAGVKTYIYSSGSREAQRMVFGNSKFGDLRKHLSGFFDTTSGPKVEARSYKEIQSSLGADSPASILFATDMYAEAKAAREAGWQAVLVIRPGNQPLPPEAAGIRTIHSLAELL
uniref:Probable methylthioribulose-1-phosphate dehydratase n=1 Tax=Tetraselmis chuii TaxID=63592 RepID=A0A7S1T1M1_9CHLO|mmetsp:Transcript_40767/g.73249  ORF Transcript_40767/g.73249 Transcript_40767/m.73249 type:complete len:489 (+) Transcript_40767:90-1556(+)